MQNLQELGKIGKLNNYQPGEVLFLQGSPGDCMYIAVKGNFGVYVNSFTDFPTKVAEIPAGAFMGEMAVIDGSPRSATVISEEQGMAVAIDKEHFRALLDNNPDIATKILKTLSSRAESTAAAAKEIAAESGKTVAEIPADLKDPDNLAPETYYDSMIYLAGLIRELNKFFNPPGMDEEIEMKTSFSAIRLLPQGYKKSDETDKRDNTSLLANFNCVCPYCGNGFKGKIPLFARLTAQAKTGDFRVIYSNMNILLYHNLVCPNCNFCDSYQEFLRESKAAKNLKVTGNQFINEEGFAGFKDENIHDYNEAVLSYYLNIECLKQTPGSELRAGKTWQRLHWLLKDMGPNYKNHSVDAAIQANENFAIFLDKKGDTLETKEFMTLNIIMGELECAVGRKENAIKCFEKNLNIAKFQTHELAIASLKRYRELKAN